MEIYVQADHSDENQGFIGIIGGIAHPTAILGCGARAGYQLAKDSLRSPLEANEKNLENGKAMYAIYCATCHGDKGDGMGTLVKNEKFLGVPNYKDRDINQGTIYHVLMYGRNLMGSHSSQLTETERWQVVHYVESLRAELLKE